MGKPRPASAGRGFSVSGPGCAVGGGPPARRPRRSLLLVAPLVVACSAAGVPGAVGPGCGLGCLVRPWAAACPRAVRAARCARRVDSLSGQTPPPPTGPAARPAFLRRPPHRRCLRGCVSPRSPARLRCPRAPQLGRRDYCASSTFARNSPVTISEFELASLELQRFWAVFKSDRGKLRATFVSLVSCHRPWAPQPGPSDPPVPCTPAVPARLCLTSKPGQAPLPTGTAAWSTRLLCVQHFRT